MPPSFDCVLISGTVVNHDGIGPRDIGVRDGRIAAIGALRRRRGRRDGSTAAACTSCRA